MTILIDAILLLAVLLLVYPKPLRVTIKRLAPVLMVLGAALCVMLALQAKGEKTVTITALNQRNESAEGSEIVVMSIVVDGTEYRADEIFSAGWINENGCLRWRNYDKPADMPNAVSAKVPADASVDILFETNKWRGHVQVQEGNLLSVVYQVDCYSNSSEKWNSFSYRSARHFSSIRIPGAVLFLCMYGALAILALGASTLGNHEREEVLEHKKQKREIWLDVLKVCSAPMIVLIHTAGWPYNHTPAGSGLWTIYLLINTIPRFAVPIFIMISGILLIGSNNSFEKTLKRAKRALILLIAWNLTYIFIQHLVQDTSDSIRTQILALPVNRGPSGHLWYSYFLLWLYLFAPIVGVLYQALNNRMRIYFVALTIFIPGVLDYYQRFFRINAEEVVHTTHIWMTLNYIGIMFIGRIIYDNVDRIKRPRVVFSTILAAGLLGATTISFAYGVANNTSPHNFYMETQLFPVCYGAGVLGLFAVFRENLERIPQMCKKAINVLSKYSIGIYFFHCIVIMTLGGKRHFPFWPLSSDGPFETVIISIIYYILTVIGVGLMSRIPYLKKLVT